MNMIDDYHNQNCKTVLHWTTGWLLWVNSLNLSSFFDFSSSPAGSFFPQGFDAPMLRFYLPLHKCYLFLLFSVAFFVLKWGGGGCNHGLPLFGITFLHIHHIHRSLHLSSHQTTIISISPSCIPLVTFPESYMWSSSIYVLSRFSILV